MSEIAKDEGTVQQGDSGQVARGQRLGERAEPGGGVRRRRRGNQRAEHRAPAQAPRRGGHRGSALDARALDDQRAPIALDGEALAAPAARERHVPGRAAEANQLPADEGRVAGEGDVGLEVERRPVEHDGLPRQPLEAGPAAARRCWRWAAARPSPLR